MGKQERRKKFKDTIEGLEVMDLPPVSHYLSTGCTILDLAVADKFPGGFAGGRVTHIFGPESTAKTVLAQEPLGAAQRASGIAHFVDVEYTLDHDRASLFGLKCEGDSWEESHPKSVEELFDIVIAGFLSGRRPDNPPAAISIDSLSALPSEKELEENLTDGGYGTTRARQLSTAFRKYIRRLATSNVATIWIDQTREDISKPYYALTVSGGKALSFYASTRVEVSHKGKITNVHDKVIGVRIGFKVTKNKIGPPFREGEFRLLFDYGIDDVGTNLEWLKENTNESKSHWFSVPDSHSEGGIKNLPGLSKAIEFVEENSLEAEVQDAVWEAWKKVHAQPERKPKSR